MKRRLIFWFGFIYIALFIPCCINNGNSESCAEKASVKKNKFNLYDIKTGVLINCVQSLERKMKSSDEHFKYIVTIHGMVEKIDLPDIYIKVEKVSVLNLKKENATWEIDQSIVKKPPYTIGKTYAFRIQHDVIDNVVSTGEYEIYFLPP